MLFSAATQAQATAPRPAWHPTTVFVQAGIAEEAEAATVGATWGWNWQKDTRFGRLTGYTDAALSRWRSRYDPHHTTLWVTQVGITPTFRLYPGWGKERVFFEAAIGVNYITPLYRTKDRDFSTQFNFGDHFAVGRRFGERRQHEVAVRLQHFSNASLRKPNPGENFLQLRYARYW